jgi:glyoxylase-like metal-dependent hydrolase (beta-lactamase superfamily II)
MVKLEQVADDIYRMGEQIPGVNVVFAVYFIRDDDGAIIEPGPAALVPSIKQAVAELGLSHPKYIIPTHIHLDHAGGLGKLAQVFPGAKIVVNRQGVRHIIEPSRLINSTQMAFGDDYETVYGPILPVPESRLKVVADGERLMVGGHELVIVYTPGHAPHHIAIFDTRTRGLFCGEALGLIYRPGYPPLPAVAPPSFDMELYLGDMERLKALKPRLLFYSHGSVAGEPEELISTVMENTRLVGDFILRDLRVGESDEAVISHVGDYLRDHFGTPMDEYELVTNVNGYIHYFRKKGLV